MNLVDKVKKFGSKLNNCEKIIIPYPVITEEIVKGTRGSIFIKILFLDFLFNLKNKEQVKAKITVKVAVHKAVIIESLIDKYKFLFDNTSPNFAKEEKINERNGIKKNIKINIINIDKKTFSDNFFKASVVEAREILSFLDISTARIFSCASEELHIISR